MPKGKSVSDEEMRDAIISLENARAELMALENRIGLAHGAELKRAFDYSRDLVCIARDCNQTALRLMDYQKAHERTKALAEALGE